MKQAQSLSTKERNKGDSKYKAYSSQLKPEKNISLLKEALQLYDSAFSHSHCNADGYEAAKSISLSCELILEVYSQLNLTTQATFDEYYVYAMKMAESCTNALLKGKLVLSTAAYYAQAERIEKALQHTLFVMAMASKHSYLMNIASLLINHKSIFYALVARIARYHFNEGMFDYNSKRYDKAKNNFANANQVINKFFTPIEDKREMSEGTVKEFNEVLESATLYIKVASVKQALMTGKEYLDKAALNQKSLDMEFCTLCLDQYREALNNAKANDGKDRQPFVVELEAKCMSRLADVMFRLMKRDDKAYELAMESINVGHTLLSRSVFTKKWYLKVRDISEQIRLKRLAKENTTNEKEYLTFKNKNAALLKELEDHAKQGEKDFIKFIKEKYPFSEITDLDIKQLDDCNKKKVLLKISFEYHPDGQPRESEEETKVYFFKQEITKHVNAFYNECKLQKSSK